MKILFQLHALLKEIQECFSSHLSQEFSAINGLRLSTNVCFARQKRPFVHGPAHLFGRLARRLDRRSNLNASVKNAIVFPSKSEECQ